MLHERILPFFQFNFHSTWRNIWSPLHEGHEGVKLDWPLFFEIWDLLHWERDKNGNRISLPEWSPMLLFEATA